MRSTIICEDKYISEVRESAKDLSKAHIPLTTPLSPTGSLPATHWMCVSDFTELGVKKLIEVRKHSIISNSSPKKLLDEMGLKIVEK